VPKLDTPLQTALEIEYLPLTAACASYGTGNRCRGDLLR
jgi:hypothetical protein